MTSIVGGYDTGLFDSSLFLLNRNDTTGQGTAGDGEELYVNVSNGNLVVMHKDAYLPSQGEDFQLVRTYNSRGIWGGQDGKGWSNNVFVVELSQITKGLITLVSPDTSRTRFYLDAATGSYVSVDGSGAYEVISYDKTAKTYSLTRSNQSVMEFDINGDLKAIRDTNGNRVEYTYANGKLQQLKDDQGHVITYVYSNGDLIRVTDELNTVLVSYEYSQGQLIASTDRAGHRTQYTYYTSGELKSITLPSDAATAARTISFDYDLDKTDSTGKTRLLRWLTDAQGNRTFFEYQFNLDNFSKYNGGVTTVVTALGINRRESNDAEYVQWRLANGFYATWDAAKYGADPSFKAQADAITVRHTVQYSYDKNGAITGVVDQSGYQTSYQYDAQENLTAIIDPNGYAVTRSDDIYWRNLRRDYGYVDLAGQGKTVAQLTAVEIAALLQKYTTRFAYDARGNLIQKTDNAGNVTAFSYTSFNKIASQTAAMGYALANSNEASVQDKRQELGYARDAASLGAADRAALMSLYTTSYSYDSRQNLIELRSPGGDITRYEYDSFGNLTKRTVFLDASDLVTASKQQVTQYVYDAYGQNIRVVDAEGSNTYNTFDHFGNLLTHTDARGGVTRYTYDNDNRVLTVTDPLGHVTVNAYDAVGNRTSVQDASGHTVLYVYDRNNMLVTTIDPKQGDASGNRVTSYSYDVTGNRTRVVDAEGRTSVYVYREDNRLLEVRTPVVANAAGSGTTAYSTRYEYDAAGNRIAVTDFNGKRSEYVYNETGLLKQTTDALGNVTQYRYDANLNQIQIVVGVQLAADRRRVLRFSFDEEDQRVAETDALGGVTRYTRDAVGNVTAVMDANGHTTEYKFDRNNRLVQETRPAVADPVTGNLVTHTVAHQYDGNGNQVAVTDENGHTSRFSFDADNQLVMVTDANGIQTVYGYDAKHNRTSIAVGVQAHLDAAGSVVIDSVADARVETIAYNEFNEITARTDGVGNALVTSDSALYKTLRQQMGYAVSVAGLSSADKQAILNAYTQRFSYDRVGNTVSVTDHLGRVTRMGYDALNREVSRTDALGQVWTQRYDGNGNRVAIVDALGRERVFAYDAVNRLVSETDALGVQTLQQWDQLGNLLSRTQAAGTADARTQTYEYDLNNRLTRSVDAMGAAQSYEYDAVGNRLKVVDGRGNATRYVYDARNRLVKTIDPLNFETRLEYDGAGNRLALIDARGGVTRFGYDAGNRLVTMTDAEGRVTSYEYDARGNRITQRTAAGTAEEEVTHFEYDAQNNLRAVVDALGNRSSSDFDRVYNRTAVTDGNGHKTTYAFDALNRQIEVTDALGQSTRWTYDAVGNRLTQTDALGRTSSWAYDPENRALSTTAADGVVTRYAYDRVGNRIEVVRAAGLAQEQHTVYQYDQDNRLVAQTDALGHVVRMEYDANGNVVAQVDALGQRTAYEYDANNRVVRVVDALGHAVQYRYDGNGNRTQVIDALGHATTTYYNRDNEAVLVVNGEGEATAFQYDHNGNRVAATRYANRLPVPLQPQTVPVLTASAADRTTRYGYDQLNRLTHTLDGEGYLVVNRYDAVGNVLETRAYAARQNPGGAGLTTWVPVTDAKDRRTQYAYDAANRRTSAVDAEGYTTAWTYDAVGNSTVQTRFLSKTDFSDPTQQQRTQFVYDANNRLVEQVSPIGVRTRIAYDARGNRVSQTDAFGSPAARTTSYAYDAADRLVSTVDALGTVTSYEFDAADRMTAQVRGAGRADARRTAYGYDAVGRLTQTVFADGTVQAQTYDAAGNLSSQVEAVGTPAQRTSTYVYDAANRLTASTVGAGTPAALTASYTLNAFGERTRQAVADGTGDARVALNAYDHLGRLIAQTDGNGIVTYTDFDAYGNRVATHVTGHTYAVDGTPIARTETVTFEYDGRNLLIAQQDGAGQRIECQYDSAGNLRFQLDGAGTAAVRSTAFSYDLSNRLLAKTVDPTGLALATRYEYDERGNLVRQTDADGHTSSAAFDALDRVVRSTDGEGFSSSFSYDVFGNQTAITTGQYLVAPGAAGYDAGKAARAFPATTRAAYDAMDRKVLFADALGTVTRYEYDARGNRVLQTEAYGQVAFDQPLDLAHVAALDASVQRTSRYSFDALNHLVDEVQPMGTVIHYTYTAAGEQSTKTVDAGQGAQYRNATTRWFYDAGGRLAYLASPDGVVTHYEYDSFGNQVRITRGLKLDAQGRPSAAPTADMRVTAREFDAGNRLLAEVVDPAGLAIRTAYEYDARNNRTAVIDGNGARTDMAYDAADRLVWARDGAGFVSAYEYNGTGLRTAETRFAQSAAGLAPGSRPAASAEDHRATARYDAAGRLVESVDARGVVTRTTYDAIGNRLAVEENATGLYDSAARTTHYTYDLANQVLSKTEPNGLVTDYRYDSVYNLVEKRVANHWLDTLNLDANGQPVVREQVQVTTYAHDLNNRVTDEIIDPDGLNLHTSWRYDSQGNRVAEVAANGYAVAGSDADWARQARAELGLVDGNGQALSAGQLSAAQRQQVLDAYTTRTWFDAMGRPVLSVDPNGHAKSATYDAVGNLLRTTVHATPLGNAALAALSAVQLPGLVASADDRVAERVYDQADRLTVERSAAADQYVGQQLVQGLRAETTHVYDAVGNVLRDIDGNGNATYHYYDGANRLIGRIDAAGYLTRFVVDAFGNTTQEILSLDRTALTASQKEALDLGQYQATGEQRVITHTFDAGNHEVLTQYPASDLYEDGATTHASVQVVRQFNAFGDTVSESVKHRLGDAHPAATHYVYDEAGRLLSKTDPRADELLNSDAAQIVALRQTLGYTNASGAGKLAAELTPAEAAAIVEGYTTHFAYDTAGNVREQVDGQRVTTFEYDAANRTLRVHYPATDTVEVSADGQIQTAANVRTVGTRVLDANGNLLAEIKPDGTRVDYRFDRANRQVAALSNGVYVAYGYNFAGDLTGIHRYFAAASSVSAPPQADAAQDQVSEITVDALGRKVAERSRGQVGDGSDDRVLQYRYDANGNQVQTIDARGNASTMVYDGLNRVVAIVNREGGITTTGYDAQGNTVSRQTGGFTAPTLLGGLSVARVSDSSALIEWNTDRATDAQVYYRVAGSAGAWASAGSRTGFVADHSVLLSGLAADTGYEFYIVSNDAFGYRLDSQASPSHLHTAVGIGDVAVDAVRQVDDHFAADVHFNVPQGASNVRVLVGRGAAGDLELDAAVAAAATQEADGSYSATLNYSAADAVFQIEWTDAQGVHRTGASAIAQQVATRELDLTLKAVPQADGSTYQLTVSWNLADALSAGRVAYDSDTDSYSVYIGISLNDGQAPWYEQAALVDGRFEFTFTGQPDGARAIFLEYAGADGSTVTATPQVLTGLVGLDQRLQNLEFDFPDTNTNGAVLSVKTRPVGSTAWTDLPDTAINGLSANVLGLNAGAYEYEATLTQGGQVLRRSNGDFTLREPSSAVDVVDAANAGSANYTLTDDALTLPDLLPVGSDEVLSFTLTDASGAAVPASFANGTLDVAALTPGSYTFRAVKTQSSTSGEPPQTTTVVVNDISGHLVVGPLTLSGVQAQTLQGSRSLTAYALDAAHTEAVQLVTQGSSTADHSWNFYDSNGWRTFSNENGGVWTRYFHDSQGNVTREVRFQRREANGAFVNAITDEGTRPSLEALLADYDAAVIAGSEHIRVTTRTWDAAQKLLSETAHSSTHGEVTSRYAYDRFGNKTVETTAEGLAGLENTVRTTYDAANRVIRVETGPFEHYDEAGQLVHSATVQTFGYDSRGNKALSTDARGNSVRMHYDAYNRLATQWDAEGTGEGISGASTLRTDQAYDVFGRLVSRTATDLSGRAAQATQTTTYAWSVFDQLSSTTDALGHTVHREYDRNGNLSAEIDPLGHATRYGYNAENRQTRRTDRLGSVWTTEYDAYGQRAAETDANGRVTTYVRGAFGQILGSSTHFTRGYANLGGEASSSQQQFFDWLGRLSEATDSFGKHLAYSYNDADEQTRAEDRVLNKAQDYGYDALGRRTSETLSAGGLVQRSETLSYNNQGWLTGVVADSGDSFGDGTELNQRLTIGYGFDAAGNRVRVLAEDGSQGIYRYDAAGRMLQGRDDKVGSAVDETISSIVYDGFGNRVSETRSGSTTTYNYDAANRIVSSSRGEQWSYDALGNATHQRNADGSVADSVYDAENRVTSTVSHATDGSVSTSSNSYDAVGNLIKTHVAAAKYRFDEITTRDVRYLERGKVIANSWVKGAKRLEGSTSYQYDVNGNLRLVDQGRKQKAKENTVTVFDYDLDGRIIAEANKATALTSANFMQGYLHDPDLAASNISGTGSGGSNWVTFGWLLWRSTDTYKVRQQLFGGATSVTTQLKSYIYADGRSVGEAQATQTLSLKKLTLTGAEPIYAESGSGSLHWGGLLNGGSSTADATPIGYQLTLQSDDLVRNASGQVDRAATARLIAERHYSGFAALGSEAQERVVAYVLSQLPSDAASIAEGSKVQLNAYILLTDAVYGNRTQITDYSLRQIGADGLPGGSVQSHVVRAGDTLQGIAQMYLGSASYWYLIADANGLQGSEALAEGTTLTIPNRIANSANTASTFKVYNESEIIGSTSPEIRTIQKKKSWFQKLVQIAIIVIMVVAAVITAGAALAAMGATGAISGTLMGMGASFASAMGAAGLGGIAGVAAAAAMGAAIYAGASILTQGLAVMAGLQDSFSWKAVGKAAVGGAVSGAAAALVKVDGVKSLFGNSETATRVAVEAGKQIAMDGKITNVAGLVGAAAAGDAFKGLGEEGSALKDAAEWATKHPGTFSAGLGMLENAVRGRGNNAMDWVGLATAALVDSGALNPEGQDSTSGSASSQGVPTRAGVPQYFDAAGNLNWKAIAVQAVGAFVVDQAMGEDAAINYLGRTLGDVVEQGAYFYPRPPAQAAQPVQPTEQDSFTGRGLHASQSLVDSWGPQLRVNDVMLPADYSLDGSGARLGGDYGAEASSSPLLYKARKGDGAIAIAQGMGADNVMAAVGYLYGSGQIEQNAKTNRGNTREGREYSYDPSRYSEDQLAELAKLGGQIVSGEAGEDKRRQAIAQAQAVATQQAEQQRISELYAQGGPRGGTGAGYDEGRTSTAWSLHSAEGNAGGSIQADQGYWSSLGAIVNSNLSFTDKLGMAWGTTKYYFRNSDEVQGGMQMIGGGLEVAGAIGLSSSGAGAALGVPLAFHGGDSIGTGFNRARGVGNGQTVTYQAVYGLTDSDTLAEVADIAPSVMAGAAGLGRSVASLELKAAATAETNTARASINLARADQIRWGYAPDEWGITTLPSGSRVYGGIPGQSAYYTTEQAVVDAGFSRGTLFQSLQVSPHPEFGYRPHMGIYEVTNDLTVPSGIATANPSLGPGGATQYFIRDYSNQLRLIDTINLGH